MSGNSKRFAAAGLFSAILIAGSASAQITTASDYNHPYGMTQAGENASVDPSLRDANGNLTVVNGQFVSSPMSQETGLQTMGVLGAGTLAAHSSTVSGASVTTLGAGFGGATTMGAASAIGNSLNVVTVGNNNTVIVNSKQINNGNQTANVNLGGH